MYTTAQNNNTPLDGRFNTRWSSSIPSKSKLSHSPLTMNNTGQVATPGCRNDIYDCAPFLHDNTCNASSSSSASSTTLSAILGNDGGIFAHKGVIPRFITVMGNKSESAPLEHSPYDDNVPRMVACSYDREGDDEDICQLMDDDEESYYDGEKEESGDHMMYRESFIDPDIDDEQQQDDGGATGNSRPLDHHGISRVGKPSRHVRDGEGNKAESASPIALACAEVRRTYSGSDGNSSGVSQIVYRHKGKVQTKPASQKSHRVHQRVTQSQKLDQAVQDTQSRKEFSRSSVQHVSGAARNSERHKWCVFALLYEKTFRPVFCALSAPGQMFKVHQKKGTDVMHSSIISMTAAENTRLRSMPTDD